MIINNFSVFKTTDSSLIEAPQDHRLLPCVIDGSNILNSYEGMPLESLVRIFQNCGVIIFVNQPDARKLKSRELGKVEVFVVPQVPRNLVDVDHATLPRDDPIEVISKLFGVSANLLKKQKIPSEVTASVAEFVLLHNVKPYKKGGSRTVSLDDLFVVFAAKVFGGFIISRDNFLDISLFLMGKLPVRLDPRLSISRPNEFEFIYSNCFTSLFDAIATPNQPRVWPDAEEMEKTIIQLNESPCLPTPRECARRCRKREAGRVIDVDMKSSGSSNPPPQ